MLVPRNIATTLWALLLLSGAAVWGAAPSAAAASSSPQLETTTLHSAPDASAALAHPGRLPAVVDVRLSGDAEGGEPTGGSPSLLVSNRRSESGALQAPGTGREAVRVARTCAVLCVFLC